MKLEEVKFSKWRLPLRLDQSSKPINSRYAALALLKAWPDYGPWRGFVRRVGIALHGSSGHGCFGYRPFSSFLTC